ncbi:McrC family protein [Bradyrhizobium sediminis]|uniref:McrC family protein n=1 Tax=Bradyrhizobium sediminis TaxID=2840469 RepID=A0A975RNZ0_9BRAD|nr:McrC family protein [Bradyrhizobium sediminis]QWG14294.1 McrC family protein [Bradyrhizobium sediminis]
MGVVDVGDVIVEILPKTADGDVRSDGAAFLGRLLRFAGKEEAPVLSDASIAAGEGGLLEIIFAWAARTIADNLRDGVPRRYEVCEEVSTAVRGRVELRHVVRQRPGRAFELTVRHAPLREDNPVGRVVRWLVERLCTQTRSLRTRALCLKLLQSLLHIAQITPTKADLERLTLKSMETRWRPLIALARIFLSQQRPDPALGGSLPAVAVLFTLHDLFEAALRRVLREGLGAHGLLLQRNSGQLLYPISGGGGSLGLRPDFRIGQKGATEATIIGDAKWKSIFDRSGLLHFSEADVYQVTTYMAALQAKAGFIVCPLLETFPQTLCRSTFAVSGLKRPLDFLGIRLSVLISDGPDGVDLRKLVCDFIAEGQHASVLAA